MRTVAGDPSAGKLDLFRADDLPFVFDVHRHGLSAIAGLPDDHVERSEAFFKTVRGVLTRSIWMSRGSRRCRRRR